MKPIFENEGFTRYKYESNGEIAVRVEIPEDYQEKMQEAYIQLNKIKSIWDRINIGAFDFDTLLFKCLYIKTIQRMINGCFVGMDISVLVVNIKWENTEYVKCEVIITTNEKATTINQVLMIMKLKLGDKLNLGDGNGC